MDRVGEGNSTYVSGYRLCIIIRTPKKVTILKIKSQIKKIEWIAIIIRVENLQDYIETTLTTHGDYLITRYLQYKYSCCVLTVLCCCSVISLYWIDLR